MHRRKPSRIRTSRASFGRRIPVFNFVQLKRQCNSSSNVLVMPKDLFKEGRQSFADLEYSSFSRHELRV